MKLTLVASIRYLEQNALPKNEVIVIDLWGDEGYELQSLARQFEGRTSLAGMDDFLISDENPCKNSQLNCLLVELGKADLAIQFIDSYPAQDRPEGGLNLTVIIMQRQVLHEVVRQLDCDEAIPLPRNVARRPLLNDFKGHGVKRNTRHRTPALLKSKN